MSQDRGYTECSKARSDSAAGKSGTLRTNGPHLQALRRQQARLPGSASSSVHGPDVRLHVDVVIQARSERNSDTRRRGHFPLETSN